MAEPRRALGEPNVAVAGARILVVEARFYDDIADTLLAGATRVLEAAQASFDRISVPGSLEIPAAIVIMPVAIHPMTRSMWPVRVNGPMIDFRENISMVIIMTGTAAMPLITAAQTRARIGLT